MWYIYHINEETHSPKKVTINGVEVEGDSYISNPYRKGGILIYKSKFTLTYLFPFTQGGDHSK